MTKQKFRDLLLVYLLVAIISAAYGIYVGITAGGSAVEMLSKIETNESLGEDIKKFQEITSDEQTISTYISTATLILLIIAWIGLFKYWRPARVVFGVYLALAYLVSPFFDFDFSEIPTDNHLFDFYCRILMEQPSYISKVMGSVITAFDTIIALVIFSAIGNHLFELSGDKYYT